MNTLIRKFRPGISGKDYYRHSREILESLLNKQMEPTIRIAETSSNESSSIALVTTSEFPTLEQRVCKEQAKTADLPVLELTKEEDTTESPERPLREKAAPNRALSREELAHWLDDRSSLSRSFLVLLVAAVVVATLGLFENNSAIIIGAMIVAPLVKPIMGLSYGALTLDLAIMRKSVLTIIAGTIIGITLAYLLAVLLQAIDATGEILARSHPTLLDLGVALFAGAAGAYCQTDETLSDTLAGVAIAVALVPPVAVIGIGLALGMPSVSQGAALLYATNLVGITFAGSLVFLIMGYGPLEQARKSLIPSLIVVVALAVPLGLSLKELILEHFLSAKIHKILETETVTFSDVELDSVKVRLFNKPISVTATVLSSKEFSPKQVKMVQNFLIKETKLPVDFKLKVIPSTVISAGDEAASASQKMR